jgi:hypothetical protein
MSDGPGHNKNIYIPPEHSTDNDSAGFKGSAKETSMPLSNKRKAILKAVAKFAPEAPKAVKLPMQLFTCSFAIVNLAKEMLSDYRASTLQMTLLLRVTACHHHHHHHHN